MPSGVAEGAALEPKSSFNKAEILLIGLQIRLDGTRAALVDRLLPDDAKAIEKGMSGLMDALMGGQFGTARPDPDPDRARLVQMHANELIVLTEDATGRALTLMGSWRYLVERSRRMQQASLGENWELWNK